MLIAYLLPIKYCPPLAYSQTVVDVLCKYVISEIKNYFTVQLKTSGGHLYLKMIEFYSPFGIWHVFLYACSIQK